MVELVLLLMRSLSLRGCCVGACLAVKLGCGRSWMRESQGGREGRGRRGSRMDYMVLER